ncbi:MAG: UDP-N-acetylmuramoyl-L-alanine--D-glutamate ligase [Acidimicrobiia bacterium]
MRILVLGAAVSGLAAARLARRLGHSVTIYDERAESLVAAGTEGFSTIAGAWDPITLHGVDLVVTSPGIPERSRPIVETLESGLALWGEIEFAWRQLEGLPVAAITGTNGKTTVTQLIADMLVASGVDARPLGNIGTPLADAVGTDLQVAVVEVSSFQLHYSDRFRPDVAVVTNVAPDHLDWHGSFDRYLEAKARIVANQGGADLLVFCSDDGGARRVAERAPGRRIGVGSSGVSDDGYGIDRLAGRMALGGWSIELDRLQVSDDAFLVDLALAAAAAEAIGGDADAIRGVIEGFTPGAHRRTVVGEIDGVRFVDDSKATNPHAALAAIRSYSSVVLIAGGLAKGLDVAPLAVEPNVRAVIAIGEAAPVLLSAAGDRGVSASSMGEAVAEACAVAERGDVILLAPGCASFDMFDSYGHRGDVFAAEVAARGGRS